MKLKSVITKMLFLFILMFLTSGSYVNAVGSGVDAEEYMNGLKLQFQFNICTSVGSYNVKVYFNSSNVDLDKNNFLVTVDSKNNKIDVKLKQGIDIGDYEIRWDGTGYNCYIDENGDVAYCPTPKQKSQYNIYETYGSTNKETKDYYIKQVLDPSTGKFTVKLKDAYNDELYVRYVSSYKNLNPTNVNSALSYTSEFLKKGSDGYYTVSNVSSSTSDTYNIIYFEFYLKNTDDCSYGYVGAIPLFIENAYNYPVTNPAISNPGGYGCDLVKNYIPGGMNDTNEKEQLLSLKENYIPECYESNIKYGKISTLSETIRSKFSTLKSMFLNYSSVTSSNDLICSDSHTKNKLTYSSVGTYWAMTCFEEYTAKGDSAKLVKAGDGFEYQTNYSVTKKCNLVQINVPSKPPQCVHECVGGCTWTNSDGTTGSGSDAGPTDDFDQCILKCDGGEYSQSCIDSCYLQVYDDDRNFSLSNKVSYRKNYSVLPVSRATGQAGITEHGNPGEVFEAECGTEYVVSDWCKGHGYSCDYHDVTSPDGCSDTPEEDYAAELASSLNEFNMLVAKRDEEIKAGNYSYEITDSYLVTADGKNYIYTVDNTNDPALLVEKTESIDFDLSTDVKENVSLGNDGGETVSFRETVVKVANIKVSLPLSYVSRITGEAAYKTSANSNGAFKINSRANKLEKISKFDILEYYNKDNKERKYYTNIWSEDLNIVVDKNNNTVSLLRTGDYNIEVTSSNVGDGAFSSNIQCFYGVYNNFFKPEDSIDDDDDDDDGGIQYIYRPIDLSDMFPNGRDPRWNWTGTVNTSNNTSTNAALTRDESFYADAVNPQAVIESIESKGESIYDVSRDPSEVDYEFVLTKENIRNIRKYNKSVRDYNGDCSNNEGNCHNYLDYNMSCYKNSKGYEVCTSKFMDNINGNSGSDTFGDNMFVTYSVPNFNITSRKNLAGCNNAKNRECFTISR